MKILHSAILLLFALFIFQRANASENQSGTLTLKNDQIIFQTASKSFTYSSHKIGDKIPDANIVKYEKKSIEANGVDTDVSEITLENISDGTKLILVESAPCKVLHTFSGKEWTWKQNTK